MCVIAFSPKGTDIPTEEQIKDMWETNPDGAGYAYVGRGGKVVYRKGFMTLKSLMEELQDKERFKNTNFAIHFRIGTAGKNDDKTCHPFPLSTHFGDLTRIEGVTDAVLFHNGIIDQGGIASPLSSDTQDFVVAVAPLLKKYSKSKTRDHFIEKFISGNRMLVLYKNQAYKMYGDWKKDGDIFVSNLNYKTPIYDYTYGLYGWDRVDWKDACYIKEKTEKNMEVAGRILGNVVDNEYAFVTEEELDSLKRASDDYTSDEIFIDGYGLGYDKQQLVVWLAYEPMELRDKKEG